MTAELLIVTDALIPAEDGYAMHPSLQGWQKPFHHCSRQWFHSPPKTPVEWYALLTGSDAAALFIASLTDASLKNHLIEDFQQCWLASPFHARLGHDQLRVMPDALFPWHEEDAVWLCDLFNPLLAEEGMKLIHQHAALALFSKEPLDANPAPFATVSGNVLPNRHPQGRDAGRLMRLMSEIQMLLNQKPAKHRSVAGEPDVDGLWVWAGSKITQTVETPERIPVATCNPCLRSLTAAKDAKIIISESDAISELVQLDQPLPGQVILAGGDVAVCLKRSLLPGFGKSTWQPKRIKKEPELVARLFAGSVGLGGK